MHSTSFILKTYPLSEHLESESIRPRSLKKKIWQFIWRLWFGFLFLREREDWFFAQKTDENWYLNPTQWKKKSRSRVQPYNTDLEIESIDLVLDVSVCVSAICKVFFFLFFWGDVRIVGYVAECMGYKWIFRGKNVRIISNSEFVMCNWQYELWLVTIYSVILHVLLSVNSGDAEYTSTNKTTSEKEKDLERKLAVKKRNVRGKREGK